MATPPFNPNQNSPTPTDLVSQYPTDEQNFRDIMESWMLWGHGTSGNHIPFIMEGASSSKGLGFGNDMGPDSWPDFRVAWNTGGFDAEIDAGTYRDAGVQKYTVGGDGATQVGFFYEGRHGEYTVRVADTGAAPGDTITWAYTMTLDERGLTLNNGVVGFASGTRMLFQQTTAPVGWTKETAWNNRAMRIVNGTVGTGGSVVFTGAFNAARAVTGTVASHILTTSEMPTHNHTGTTSTTGAHDHFVASSTSGSTLDLTATRYMSIFGNKTPIERVYELVGVTSVAANVGLTNNTGDHNHTFTTSNAGSGSGHTHGWSGSVNLDVLYVDFIIATHD